MRSSILPGALSLAASAFSASIGARQDETDGQIENDFAEVLSMPVLEGQDIVELEPTYFGEEGAKKIKVRYGPLLVPGIGDPETMGMKSFDQPVQMPCGDCLVTTYVAGLEFADGTNANANSGMWLHHSVFLNANQSDVTCADSPNRFLASGNERTPLDFTNGGSHKAGVYIGEEDQVAMTTELMNESALPREAYLTIEWTYIPASTAGFQAVKSVWLDVSGLCSPNGAEIEVPVGTETFSQMMDEGWSMPWDGTLLANFGHMHDGAVHQTLYVNGRDACDHVATYGGDESFITHVGMYGHEEGAPDYASDEGEGGAHEHEHEHKKKRQEEEHGHVHEEGEEHEHAEEGEHEHAEAHDHAASEHIPHISEISYCNNGMELKAGDKLQLVTYYDFTQHTAMAGHHGGLEPVMGITVLYILPKNTETLTIESEEPAESVVPRDYS